MPQLTPNIAAPTPSSTRLRDELELGVAPLVRLLAVPLQPAAQRAQWAERGTSRRHSTAPCGGLGSRGPTLARCFHAACAEGHGPCAEALSPRSLPSRLPARDPIGPIGTYTPGTPHPRSTPLLSPTRLPNSPGTGRRALQPPPIHLYVASRPTRPPARPPTHPPASPPTYQ